jgi:hypothetical protein
MRLRAASIAWGFLAFLIGAFPAFWLGGPALFADGAMGERLGALAAYAGAMFVLAIGGGALAPSRRLAVCVGLALPIVLVLLLASWDVAWTVALSAGFVVAAVAASWAGTLVGVRLTAAVAARRGAGG